MKTSENLKLRNALEDAIVINNAASKAAIAASNKAIKAAANLVKAAKAENAILVALAANKIANDTLAAVMRKG